MNHRLELKYFYNFVTSVITLPILIFILQNLYQKRKRNQKFPNEYPIKINERMETVPTSINIIIIAGIKLELKLINNVIIPNINKAMLIIVKIIESE